MLLLLHIPVFGLPLAVLIIAVLLDQIGRYDLLLHIPVFGLPLAVLVIAVILDQIQSNVTVTSNSCVWATPSRTCYSSNTGPDTV